MSLHHQYNGFEVYAHAYEFSGGYVPSVTLTRGNPANIAERKFGPPVTSSARPRRKHQTSQCGMVVISSIRLIPGF